MTPADPAVSVPLSGLPDGDPLQGLPDASKIGPWTIRTRQTPDGTRTRITAACARCGAVPCDEPLGMYASFPTIDHARQELPRDWGWHVTTTPGGTEQILCPRCASAIT